MSIGLSVSCPASATHVASNKGRPFTSCQRRTGHRAPPTTFRYYTDMVEDLREGGDAAFTGRGRPPRSQQLANRPAPPGGGDGRRRRRIPGWWRRGDSNPRPPACKAGALPLSYVPTPHRERVHPQFTIAASSLEKECPLRLRPSLPSDRPAPDPSVYQTGGIGLAHRPASYALSERRPRPEPAAP